MGNPGVRSHIITEDFGTSDENNGVSITEVFCQLKCSKLREMSARCAAYLLWLLVHLELLAVAQANRSELKKSGGGDPSLDDLTTNTSLLSGIYYEYDRAATGSYSPEVCFHDACLAYRQFSELEDCKLNCTRNEARTFTFYYLSTCSPSFEEAALSKARDYVQNRRAWMMKQLRQRGTLAKSLELKDRMQDLMDMLSILMCFSAVHGASLDTEFFIILFKQEVFEDSYIDANELNIQLAFFQEALESLRQPKQSTFILERIEELSTKGISVECGEALILNISEQNKLREYLEEEYLKLYEEYKVAFLFRNYINICAFWFIVLTGVIWNGTLLLIFARHKELRTTSNMMLINVVVVDILNLVVVPPVRYITMYYSPTIFMGIYACRVYMFFAVSLRFAAEFALLSLTAQRFAATTGSMKMLVVRRPSEGCRANVHIFSVWMASFMFALPVILFTFRQEACFYYADRVEDYSINILYMVVSSAVVPIAILVLSVLMSRELRHSGGETLGEGRCHGSQDLARNRSARVLLALALLFILTHCPRIIWCGLVSLQVLSRRRVLYLYLEEIFAYLFFLNSGLNPIAMYLVSSTYRKLFNRYLLPCWHSAAVSADNIQKHRQSTLLKPYLVQVSTKF